jgi:hypothetical protein
MSVALKTFWTLVARGCGGFSVPRKNGRNWTIPAVVSSRFVSAGGIRDDDGKERWSRSWK